MAQGQLYDLRCAGEAAYTAAADRLVHALICDIEDAFMTVPWHRSESQFAVALVDDPSSPSGRYYYVWKTLGFVGKTLPNVFARVASFGPRTGAALMDPSTNDVLEPLCASHGNVGVALACSAHALIDQAGPDHRTGARNSVMTIPAGAYPCRSPRAASAQ